MEKNITALAFKINIPWQRSLCKLVTVWTEADAVMWLQHFQIWRVRPGHHWWSSWDSPCNNPNRRWQQNHQTYLSAGSLEEAHASHQHSPLSCSAACDRPPSPHQTAFYTEAGQYHPAILREEEVSRIQSKNWSRRRIGGPAEHW